MQSNSRIQIIAITENKGVSKKTGMPYHIREAQCIVNTGNGQKVGVISLPQALFDTMPGQYDATFEVDIDMDKRVVARLTELKAVEALKPIKAAL